MEYTGPQRFLIESLRYGYDSRFFYKRNDIIRLRHKLDRLQEELQNANVAPDLRDQESDRDRSGGVRYIRQAIARVTAQLKAAEVELKNLGDNWNALLDEK